jgi:hypothetical protein
MLPNWLYTQGLLSVAAAEQAADPGRSRDEALRDLLRTPLNGAIRPDRYRSGAWEHTGRALSALGSIRPDAAVAFAEHLSEQYRLVRGGEQGPKGVLVPPAEASVDSDHDGRPQPYLVRAALLASVAVGISTTEVRTAARADAEGLGAATTYVLTAQAAVVRVLSMLDVLATSGRDAGGTVSAGFHTVVRGAMRLLEQAGPGAEILAITGHQVLSDVDWNDGVAKTLLGDWAAFGVPA